MNLSFDILSNQTVLEIRTQRIWTITKQKIASSEKIIITYGASTDIMITVLDSPHTRHISHREN